MVDELLTPPRPPSPFIGREAEMERLDREVYRQGWAPAIPIVIRGEAGIGKSSFVTQFLTRGARREQLIWIPCREWKAAGPAFEAAMREPTLERRNRNRETVVVLDGADETSEKDLMEMFSRVVNFKLVRTLLITSRTELRFRGHREIVLERLPQGDAELLVKGSLSLSSLDENLLNRIIVAGNGHPLAISLVTNMARTMDPEHLRRVLAGHLYDLNDAAPSAKRDLITAAEPIIVSANEAMIKALKKQPEDIFKLTPRQYEELIAELIHGMGYDVTLTQATRDGGKDILASIKTGCGDFLCLVDAKHYRQDRKIGVSLVRTLYGTLCDYQANSAMLVTTSSYSKDAHALQKKHQYQLSLRDYTDVAGWIQRYGSNQTKAGS